MILSSRKKHDKFLSKLETGLDVIVQFDPRRNDVLVPEYLTKQPYTGLQYGLNISIPIPDLEVTEKGILATLLFSGKQIQTFVPWKAVFAMVTSGEQREVVDELPDGSLEYMQSGVPREAKVHETLAPKKKGGHLRLVVDNT